LGNQDFRSTCLELKGKTLDETIGKVLGMSKKINQVLVVVGNWHGFVGNRMLKCFVREFVEEGASILRWILRCSSLDCSWVHFAMIDRAGKGKGKGLKIQ